MKEVTIEVVEEGIVSEVSDCTFGPCGVFCVGSIPSN